MKKLKKAGQGSDNFKKQQDGNENGNSGFARTQASISGATGHTHIKAWSASGRSQGVRTTQLLEKRKAGVWSTVPDNYGRTTKNQ